MDEASPDIKFTPTVRVYRPLDRPVSKRGVLGESEPKPLAPFVNGPDTVDGRFASTVRREDLLTRFPKGLVFLPLLSHKREDLTASHVEYYTTVGTLKPMVLELTDRFVISSESYHQMYSATKLGLSDMGPIRIGGYDTHLQAQVDCYFFINPSFIQRGKPEDTVVNLTLEQALRTRISESKVQSDEERKRSFDFLDIGMFETDEGKLILFAATRPVPEGTKPRDVNLLLQNESATHPLQPALHSVEKNIKTEA